MSDLLDSNSPRRRPNPMVWIGLAVLGLIIFVLLTSNRGRPIEPVGENSNLDNSLMVDSGNLSTPPGMRARHYIAEIRSQGHPYPLASAFAKASDYQDEGSLADAHLLYFFSAREGYLPAMMQMAEMADPTLFRAEDSLLDQADVVQAFKWYQKASLSGDKIAAQRVKDLKQWVMAESDAGNADARLILLNFDE